MICYFCFVCLFVEATFSIATFVTIQCKEATASDSPNLNRVPSVSTTAQ